MKLKDMMKFEATKSFYLDNQGLTTLLGGRQVKVSKYVTNSRGGTWGTGFKFYSTEWAMLVKNPKRGQAKIQYSMDHGKTWHPTKKLASMSKGKMKLDSSSHKEFAFDGIQKICRDYEGPSYKWRR